MKESTRASPTPSCARLEMDKHTVEGLDHDTGGLQLRAVPIGQSPLPLAGEGEHRDLGLENGHVLSETEARSRIERRHFVLIHGLDLDLPPLLHPPSLGLEHVSVRPEDIRVPVEEVGAVVDQGTGGNLVPRGGHGVLLEAHLLLRRYRREAPPHFVEQRLAHGDVVHVPEGQGLVDVFPENVLGLFGEALLPLQPRLVFAQQVGEGGEGRSRGVTPPEEEGEDKVPQVGAGVGLALLAAVHNEQRKYGPIAADGRGDLGAVCAEVLVNYRVDVLVEDFEVRSQLALHSEAEDAGELPRGEQVTLDGEVLDGVKGTLELEILGHPTHGVDRAIERDTVGGVESVTVPHRVHVYRTPPRTVHQRLVHLLGMLSEDE
eukprot:Hpha_TRINITY_DN16403_c0_g7::TRINITY_DN16403_c0_g7_i1::g.159183::m.159183